MDLKSTIDRAATVFMTAAVLSCAAPSTSPEKAEIQQMAGWLCTERPVRSWKDFRDQHVILQKFDYP